MNINGVRRMMEERSIMIFRNYTPRKVGSVASLSTRREATTVLYRTGTGRLPVYLFLSRQSATNQIYF
jgi:hypothetical protein